jgi:uncharacterized membrane protein
LYGVLYGLLYGVLYGLLYGVLYGVLHGVLHGVLYGICTLSSAVPLSPRKNSFAVKVTNINKLKVKLSP